MQTVAKREESASFVPARQITWFHASGGTAVANTFAEMG
jgi:hypothetical protein